MTEPPSRKKRVGGGASGAGRTGGALASPPRSPSPTRGGASTVGGLGSTLDRNEDGAATVVSATTGGGATLAAPLAGGAAMTSAAILSARSMKRPPVTRNLARAARIGLMGGASSRAGSAGSGSGSGSGSGGPFPVPSAAKEAPVPELALTLGSLLPRSRATAVLAARIHGALGQC
jgi:hypothetical protein